MKRRIIIPIALLGLVACGDDDLIVIGDTPDTVAVARTAPPDDVEIIALEIAWDNHRTEICGALADIGGLTPTVERLAIQSLEDGWGEPLSPAGRRRVVELMQAC
jgi:hypothetical protein